jgi:hypothetical protein
MPTSSRLPICSLCNEPVELETAKTNEAAELVNAISEARHKEAETNRQANERFYNNLALFSGGTVALSITYLGYLKTLPRPIQHPRWLMVSWVAMVTCAACSLLWSFFYGHYVHYARGRGTSASDRRSRHNGSVIAKGSFLVNVIGARRRQWRLEDLRPYPAPFV